MQTFVPILVARRPLAVERGERGAATVAEVACPPLAGERRERGAATLAEVARLSLARGRRRRLPRERRGPWA
jgi:hypothetical protein